MAKIVPSNINFSGNLFELNFVNSRNGKYVRRKRGTVTVAKINASLRKNAARTKIVNRSFVPIHAAMKYYAGFFKDGDFCRDMRRRLMKCSDDLLLTHLKSLQKLELNKLHRMEWHVNLPTCNLQSKKDYVAVNMQFKNHPKFKNSRNNSYCYEAVLLLWDNKTKEPVKHSIETEWVNFDNEVPHYDFIFERTPKHNHYLLILKLLGGINKISEQMMADKAMIILEGGKVTDKTKARNNQG